MKKFASLALLVALSGFAASLSTPSRAVRPTVVAFDGGAPMPLCDPTQDKNCQLPPMVTAK